MALILLRGLLVEQLLEHAVSSFRRVCATRSEELERTRVSECPRRKETWSWFSSRLDRHRTVRFCDIAGNEASFGPEGVVYGT
jgi:hypothetical protein